MVDGGFLRERKGRGNWFLLLPPSPYFVWLERERVDLVYYTLPPTELNLFNFLTSKSIFCFLGLANHRSLGGE